MVHIELALDIIQQPFSCWKNSVLRVVVLLENLRWSFATNSSVAHSRILPLHVLVNKYQSFHSGRIAVPIQLILLDPLTVACMAQVISFIMAYRQNPSRLYLLLTDYGTEYQKIIIARCPFGYLWSLHTERLWHFAGKVNSFTHACRNIFQCRNAFKQNLLKSVYLT